MSHTPEPQDDEPIGPPATGEPDPQPQEDPPIGPPDTKEPDEA